MAIRSFAVGKSIMPKIANSVSGKTSEVRRAGAGRPPSPGRAGRRGAHRGEGVGADAAEPLGHGQHAEDAHEQDRALQEEGRAVDGEREERPVGRAVGQTHREAQVAARREDESRRPPRARPTTASVTWMTCRRSRGREGLDEHADEGRDEDDEQRHDRHVVDVGRLERGRKRRLVAGAGRTAAVTSSSLRPRCRPG